MIKRTIKLLLPSSARHFLWMIRNDITKKYILKKWNRKGDPQFPPHVYKQKVISDLQKKFMIKTFVETGTLDGDMIAVQKNNFKTLFSIELSEKFYEKAKKRFIRDKKIEIIHGDSGEFLSKVVDRIHESAIFWLDGHHSAGETAFSDKSTPIFAEIDAIFSNTDNNHILIIDDAKSFDGQGDYPTIEILEKYIKTKNNSYNIKVNNGIITAIKQ